MSRGHRPNLPARDVTPMSTFAAAKLAAQVNDYLPIPGRPNQVIISNASKFADIIPVLGHHLTARSKTGYFCSSNPHPDRPVAWKL